MMAQCRICGLLLPEQIPVITGATSAELFQLLSLSAFIHLVQRHPEHVEAVCQPAMGAIANYLASLTLQSSNADFEPCRVAAREGVEKGLREIRFSDLTKQFCSTDSTTGTTVTATVAESD